MSKTVVIVGALDTKGAEFNFVKSLIEAEGLRTLVVDFGVMGSPAFAPDVSRAEVAAAGSGDLARLAGGGHKDEAMQVMADGLAVVVRRLYDEGRLDGIIGMGGSGGTSIATTAMRTLPVGVPKVMVSTVGGGDVSAYAGTKDITFMPSIVDVAGINSISRAIYTNAAGAIAGAPSAAGGGGGTGWAKAGPAAKPKPPAIAIAAYETERILMVLSPFAANRRARGDYDRSSRRKLVRSQDVVRRCRAAHR